MTDSSLHSSINSLGFLYGLLMLEHIRLLSNILLLCVANVGCIGKKSSPTLLLCNYWYEVGTKMEASFSRQLIFHGIKKIGEKNMPDMTKTTGNMGYANIYILPILNIWSSWWEANILQIIVYNTFKVID